MKLTHPYVVSLFPTVHAVSIIKQGVKSQQFSALILMAFWTVQRADGTCHSQRG